MAHSSTTMDMTKGSIWKSLFLFSLPLLLGNLFQQLYSTVDSLVVGNFVGADALGAVTSMMPAVNTLIGLLWESVRGPVSSFPNTLAPMTRTC
ncbi:oligosaccharide flippase family protein [Acidaminococcus intestini]|nr:oligosaccharide flippase family protein [Acidaminococcus intestini]